MAIWKNYYLPGWDEERVRRVLAHYELQTDEEAVEEDTAAFENEQTMVQVPVELMPLIRELIGQYQTHKVANG